MVDTGEKLAHIQRQQIAAQVGGAAVEGAVGALAHPVGEAVVDKRTLEQGSGHIHQGVVDDPVAKRRSGDQATFGVVHDKAGVATLLGR